MLARVCQIKGFSLAHVCREVLPNSRVTLV
jgi:hypothetical protein